MTFGMDNYWRRFAIKKADIKPDDKVLDICCGTGMMTREIAKIVGEKGEVIGLDFSEKMLKIAREKTSKFRYKERINFIQGNAMSLPFKENTFDAVTVGWGLRNVPDITKVIGEMVRVVKPGKKIISIDMGKPEIPLFKELYWIYFEKIIPLLGKLIAHKKDAYKYLYESSKAFPHQKELAKMFEENGLENTVYYNLFGGVVAVVLGIKPKF